jgi:hypothetical protein
VDAVVILPPDSSRSGRPFGHPNDDASAADVGAFAQGDDLSRWALGRYLLGRALAVQVSRVLLAVALLIAAAAIALYLGGFTVLAVLVGLVAVAVLGARAILMAVLRHTTMPSIASDGERRLAALVADTRKDVGRELRRLGLPSRALTLPLLAWRLAGRRRNEVLTRLRGFDVERVVPAGRLDEVHLLLAPRARRGDPLR